MWRQALICCLIVVLLEAKITFDNIEAPNTRAENVSNSDPRVNQLIQRALAHLSLRLESQIASMPDATLESPNIIFSPLNIAHALALVLLGARGVTHAELAKLLGVTSGTSLTGRSNSVHEELSRLLDMLRKQRVMNQGTSVNLACGLFLQQDLRVNQTFLHQTVDLYHTEVQRVDFQYNPSVAQGIINEWMEIQTKGHIKNLLGQEPDTNTKAVITSAIYFLGQWKYPFDMDSTQRAGSGSVRNCLQDGICSLLMFPARIR